MKTQFICLLSMTLVAATFQFDACGQDSDRRSDRRDKGRQYSREQIEGHLKRLDENDSQILELNEMSDRTKGWLRGLGLDTSRPVKVSSVMRKVDAQKSEQARIERRQKLDASRLVPGFGIEDSSSEGSAAGVPDFSDASPINPGSLEEKYGKSVMRQVESTLERYDANKSGTLNSQEIASARWGRPTPQDSDTNKDGRLTRSELAERYAARASSSRKSSSDSDKKSSEEKGRTSSSRGSSRDSDSRSKSRSGGSDLKSRMSQYQSKVDEKYDKDGASDRKKTSTKDSSYNSGTDRYKRYADALLKQYDKDKDNQLSKSEVKSMRRPPNRADSNGDGMITRDELIESIANPKSSSTRSSDSEEKSSRSSSRSRFSDRSRSTGSDSSKSSSRSSSRSSSSRVSFSGNDTNKDGQLQMHEFAKEWDAETLEEYQKKDKNGDGVITRAEWTGR